MKICAGSPAAL